MASSAISRTYVGDGLGAAPETVDVIRAAALSVFAEHGFDGSSIRDVASRASMSIAGLYHHFPSKIDILFDVMVRTMDDLIDAAARVLEEAGSDPASRLSAIVQMHVLFHTERRAESFISNTELRSLDLERRAEIMAKRDSYQRTVYEIIAQGQRERVFDVSDVAGVTRALITMCTTVATWYRKDGPSTPEEIARLYSELGLRLVGHNGTGAARSTGGSAGKRG